MRKTLISTDTASGTVVLAVTAGGAFAAEVPFANDSRGRYRRISVDHQASRNLAELDLPRRCRTVRYNSGRRRGRVGGSPRCVDEEALMGQYGVTRRTALSAGLATAALTATGALTGCGNDNQDDRPSTDQPSASGTVASGTVLTSLNALPVGGIVAVTIDKIPAFVVRPAENTIGAFSAICTHQGCTVTDGGDALDCACHGARFARMTGAVLRGPATEPLPPIAVHVNGNDVLAG